VTQQPRAPLRKASLLRICHRGFPLEERREDEEAGGGADATVGHIEGRPWIREPHVQVEEEEIHDVAVGQPVGKIAENPGDEQRDGPARRAIPEGAALEKDHQRDECDGGKNDEEKIVAGEEAERGAGIREINEVEEIGDHGALLVQFKVTDDPPFRRLVEGVKRKGDGEEKFHGRFAGMTQLKKGSAYAVARWFRGAR